MRHSSLVALFLILGPLAGCATEPPVSPSEVVAVYSEVLPPGPDAGAWQSAPIHSATLILQDMVEPRLMEPSTSRVRVQAASDGKELVVRLEWTDPTEDSLPGIARYADACAIQLPYDVAADVPAPQMGEASRPVEITYWSAFWQTKEGEEPREDTIKALYPGAAPDHYPFQAPTLEEDSEDQRELARLYSPARSLGNLRSGPRTRPVSDLRAEGPGTLSPASEQVSQGEGRRTAEGWVVVLRRPLPEGLNRGDRSQIAFAVWQGSEHEVGARKMRSVWIPLHLEDRE